MWLQLKSPGLVFHEKYTGSGPPCGGVMLGASMYSKESIKDKARYLYFVKHSHSRAR